MAQKISAALPPNMDLDASYVIEFAALDPTTGDPVTGVVVSNAYMLVTQLTPGTADALESGPFMLVPGPNT
jgi:hypothetical protein